MRTVAMMALRRTPLLPPGWGLGRPSCSGIGASSVVRAAVSSAGMLLAGGRRSAALQIAFCSAGHFLLFCAGAQRRPSRTTGGCCRPRSTRLVSPFLVGRTGPGACVRVCWVVRFGLWVRVLECVLRCSQDGRGRLRARDKMMEEMKERAANAKDHSEREAQEGRSCA